MGRSRKSNVRRYACGKVVQESEWIARRVQEQFFSGQPHRKGTVHPLDSRLGYQLGRLFCNKLVSQRQHDAGERWTKTVLIYNRVMGFPNLGNQHFPGKFSSPGPDEDAIAEAREAYEAAQAAIVARERGSRAHALLKACRDVCVFERAEIGEKVLADLRLGLDRLAKHYGLEGSGGRIHPFGQST